ncbi:putative disease resistance protein RGA1 [Spinacia oleracea]|uniref:Disease resistance protein RGA1 n=1 Tax=Spinacia oleracea TaxID=3562 RepID=A0A9R0JRA0_SPIOL|nr:putative disease resistance protein RGA1 [Spinacia oleracea]
MQHLKKKPRISSKNQLKVEEDSHQLIAAVVLFFVTRQGLRTPARYSTSPSPAALQCSEVKQICSILGCKSQLNDLSGTVVRIKAALEDAEAKQELSKQDRLFIEELKDAVYDADDLFDEFVTLAERKKLSKGIKVRVLALFGKYGTAYKMAQGVKMIKKKLDAIASDTRFNFNIDPKPIRNRRLESCSYVYEADIIGREPDLEKIVGVLLDPIVQQNVSFLPIVGMGGLGKTALAQLVFNDARVKNTFPLMLWTCVADENQESLDVKGVLSKILASANKGHMKNEGCTMDGLQSQLREQLAGKKYLLVLDDVWTENSEQWRILTQFLMGGQRGSWIVVTTRSKKTARIIGDGPRHELQGLSKDNSWCLFKRVAFGSQHANPPEDLVKVGEDIVVRCANVPLAIRVVGSLLYDQEKHKWLSVQKLGLAKVGGGQVGIIPILKLSYYQLDSPLKCCFGYCAIFPKDHRISKMKLIQLWMAQGYIQLDGRHLNMEDVAEEFFSILLRRCFFQDVEIIDGEIWSVKIHDLMHDVAQEVAGKEICIVNTINGDVDKKVRHLSVFNTRSSGLSFTKTHIRSYLSFDYKMGGSCVAALLANWKHLRALSLKNLQIKSLPDSIGELIHLRYLDLSHNKALEILPRPITKLHNLQTFSLFGCYSLKELPKDLSKLVKLRVLDLIGCSQLSYLPRGIGNLTCLHTLNTFMLRDWRSNQELFSGLEDLKALRNLKGFLEIQIPFMHMGASAVRKNGGKEGSSLGNKEHLKEVKFCFSGSEGKGRVEYDEAVMEELQPHPNLERFRVYYYRGVRMSSWPMEDKLTTFLPNLVHMVFWCCPNLQYSGQLRFPRLKTLEVYRCPNLIAFMQCPALEDLTLHDFNKELEIIPMRRIKSKEFGEATPSVIPASSSSLSYDIGLKLTIDNVAWLNSLPMDSFLGVVELVIQEDIEVESLGEAKEVFCSYSSSLISLKIKSCSKLKSVVFGGLEHLTALENLEIENCSHLIPSEEVEREDGMPWQPVHHPLRSLYMGFLPRLVDLPNWTQYLTSLETLQIKYCKGLESVPNWMSELTSLKELKLGFSSERLIERCKQYTGEDWPHIEHIPEIRLYDNLKELRR